MKPERNKNKIPLYIGVVFLLCLIAAELIFILKLNNGLLVYTLDDPYIHLALGENIRHGHYGINTGELSAPSSSILWPFIIAPFSSFEYAPLIINIAASIAIIFIFTQILDASLNTERMKTKNLFTSAIVALFILTTNIVGILFTGMEHSLQVLLVLLVAYGLILEIEKKETRRWLLAAIIAAPLVRYECASISASAILFLAARGHIKPAIFSMASISLLVGGFAIFLTSLGLGPLPSSVTAKSSIVQSSGALHSVTEGLARTLDNRQGAILLLSALILSLYSLMGKDGGRRQISLVAVLSLFGHFSAGQYGWYNRYEIYAWAFTLVVIMYVFAPPIRKSLARNDKLSASLFAIAITVGIAVMAARPYIKGLFSLPLAANNIYRQQYQMHRFAVDYYKKPIAVNDLGYVAYKNSNHVLDLWGLGSEKALRLRLNEKSGDWMRDISNEANTGLVMIYQDWFENVPKEWIKIGELHLGNKRITPASNKVAFYATSSEAKLDIEEKLRFFITTLPAGVKFIYTKD